MPELPEVETVMRGLEPFLEKAVVRSVETRRSGLRCPFPVDLSERLNGRKITALERRAKYILVHVAGAKSSDADILLLHLGMSGQIKTIADMRAYEPAKHDHLILTLKSGAGIVFHDPRRFGMVLMFPERERAFHPSLCSIGPEPLEAGWTGAALHKALINKKVPIKTALLDQHIVAGIGNIYASEALYGAGISPLRPASSLDLVETKTLVREVKAVLRRAIKAGGSTLKDFTHVDGSLGYFQHRFAVYDGAGRPCERCVRDGRMSTITKINQSGRATYYCPHCQT